jgi:hypothetical protein
MRCCRAAVDLEAELTRLGLPVDSPALLAAGGTPDRVMAVMGLRGLLLQMRGEDVTRWGEGMSQSGVWGGVLAGSRELPNLGLWGGQLRELTSDLLRLPADRGQGGAGQGQGTGASRDQGGAGQGRRRRTRKTLEESHKESDKLKLDLYTHIQQEHASGKKPAAILADLKANRDRKEQVAKAGLTLNKAMVRAALARLPQRERDARKKQDSPPA